MGQNCTHQESHVSKCENGTLVVAHFPNNDEKSSIAFDLNIFGYKVVFAWGNSNLVLLFGPNFEIINGDGTEDNFIAGDTNTSHIDL